MNCVLQNGFWPDRPISEAPVWISVSIDDGAALHGGSKEWKYKIEIKLADFRGIAMAESSTVEAANERDAQAKVYLQAIECLAQLLAARVKVPT